VLKEELKDSNMDELLSVVSDYCYHLQTTTELVPYMNSKIQLMVEESDEGLSRFAEMIKDGAESSKVVEAIVSYVVAETIKPTYDALFSDCSAKRAKRLSRQERTVLNIINPSLMYGEVDVLGMSRILFGKHITLRKGGVFYDLGSGTGRAVIASALLHNWERVWGIEILDSLSRLAGGVLDNYDLKVRDLREDGVTEQKIGFTRASLLDVNWCDGDVVFMSSTCFDKALMDSVRERAKGMKVGSYLISVTKRLKSPHFKLVGSQLVKQSWGEATCHIQVRLPEHIMLPVSDTDEDKDKDEKEEDTEPSEAQKTMSPIA
jgi:SAM-dependent methyltransferase